MELDKYDYVSQLNSTRISNELGAGCPEGAYLAVKVALFIALAVGVSEFSLLMLIRNIWGHAFTNVHEVVRLVASVIPIVAVITFVDSIQTILSGTLFIKLGCELQILLPLEPHM